MQVHWMAMVGFTLPLAGRDEAAGLAAGNVSMGSVCLVAAPAERCCDQQKVET